MRHTLVAHKINLARKIRPIIVTHMCVCVCVCVCVGACVCMCVCIHKYANFPLTLISHQMRYTISCLVTHGVSYTIVVNYSPTGRECVCVCVIYVYCMTFSFSDVFKYVTSLACERSCGGYTHTLTVV